MAYRDKYERALKTGDTASLFSNMLPKTPVKRTDSAKLADSTTTALGFLPINVKYMSDYNNGFAINSYTDAILNEQADRKRWEGTALNPDNPLTWLPRKVANVLELINNYTLKPVYGTIAQSLKEDKSVGSFFKGLGIGVSTSALNFMQNFGETMDVLANPVKGLAMEGLTGLKRATIGDSEIGRKNYDWDIDPNSSWDGVANLILETVSDPFNWVSFGASGAAKATGEKIASASMEAATKELGQEVSESVTKRIGKNVAKAILNASGKELKEDLPDIVRRATNSKSWTARIASRVFSEGDDVMSAAEKFVKNKYANALQRAVATGDDEIIDAVKKQIRKETAQLTADTNKKLVQGILDRVTGTALDELPGLKWGNRLYKLSEGTQRALTKAVGLTSILGPAVLGRTVIKGLKAANLNHAAEVAQRAGVSNTASFYNKLVDLERVLADATVDNKPVIDSIKELVVDKDRQTIQAVKNKVIDSLIAAKPQDIPDIIQNLKPELDSFINNFTGGTYTNFTDYHNFISTTLPHDKANLNLFDNLDGIAELAAKADASPIERYQTAKAFIAPYKTKTTAPLADTFSDAYTARERIMDKATYPMSDNIEVPHLKNNSVTETYDEVVSITDRLDYIINNDTPSRIYYTMQDNAVEPYAKLKDTMRVHDDIANGKLIDNAGELTEAGKRIVSENKTAKLEIRYKPAAKHYASAKRLKQDYDNTVKNIPVLTDALAFSSNVEAFKPVLQKVTLAVQHGDVSEITEALTKAKTFFYSNIHSVANSTDAATQQYIINVYQMFGSVEQYANALKDKINTAKLQNKLTADIADYNKQLQQLRTFEKEFDDVFDGMDPELFDMSLEDGLSYIEDVYSIDEAKFTFSQLWWAQLDEDRAKRAFKYFKQQLVQDKRLETELLPKIAQAQKELDILKIIEHSIEPNSEKALSALQTVFTAFTRARDVTSLEQELQTMLTRSKTIAELIDNVSDDMLDVTQIDITDAIKELPNYTNPGRTVAYTNNIEMTAKEFDTYLHDAMLSCEGEAINYYNQTRSALETILKDVEDNVSVEVDGKNMIPVTDIRTHVNSLPDFSDKTVVRYRTISLGNLFENETVAYNLKLANIYTTNRMLSNETLNNFVDAVLKPGTALHSFFNDPNNATIQQVVDVKNFVVNYNQYRSLVNELRISLGKMCTPQEVQAIVDALTGVAYKPLKSVKSDPVKFVNKIVESAGLNKQSRGTARLYNMDALLHQDSSAIIARNNTTIHNLLLQIRNSKSTKGYALYIDNRKKYKGLFDMLGVTADHKAKKISVPDTALIVDDATQVAAARRIQERLQSGTAHTAITDVQNMIDYLELEPNLKPHLAVDEIAAYCDTETTGSLINDDLLELCVSIPKDNGGYYTFHEYCESSFDKLPDTSVLKKLYPGEVTGSIVEQEATLRNWFKDTYCSGKYKAASDVIADYQTWLNKITQLTGRKPVYVGQNIDKFDIDFLQKRFDGVFDNVKTHDTYTTMLAQNGIEPISEKAVNKLTAIIEDYLDAASTTTRTCFAQTTSYATLRQLNDLKKEINAGDVVATDMFPITKGEAMPYKTTKQHSGKTAAKDIALETVTTKTNAALNPFNKVTEALSDEYADIFKLNKDARANYVVVNKAKKTLEYAIPDDPYIKSVVRFTEQEGTLPNKYNIMSILLENETGIVPIGAVTAFAHYFRDYIDLDALAKNGLLVENGISTQTARILTTISKSIRKIRDNIWDISAYTKQADFADNIKVLLTKLIYNGQSVKRNPWISCFKVSDNTVNNLAMIQYITHADIKDIINNTVAISKRVSNVAKQTVTYEDMQHVLDDAISSPIDNYFRLLQDKNLRTASQQARATVLREAQGELSELDKYLTNLSEHYSSTIADIRHCQSVYADTAIVSFLKDTDRVEHFLDEVPYNGGRKVFYTKEQLDLSDFTDSCVVYQTALADHKGYLNFIGVRADKYSYEELVARNGKAPELCIVKDAIKDAKVSELLNKTRARASTMIKGMGYSDGTLITQDIIEAIDNWLPEDIQKQLISVAELDSGNFFTEFAKANTTILGDNSIQHMFNEYHASDPFRSSINGIMQYQDNYAPAWNKYIHMMYNDDNGLSTSDVWNKLTPEQLLHINKNNPDLVVCYIKPSKRTIDNKGNLIGYELHEVPMNNKHSVKLAKKLNAHVVTKDVYYGLTKAINQYKLPPVARFLNGVALTYKCGYLSSVGFLIRNFIDSTSKNAISMDEPLGLPKQLAQFFNTLSIVNKYEKFMTWCTENEYFGVTKGKLNFNMYGIKDILRDTKSPVPANIRLDPDVFEVVHSFITHGPSAGLAKSVEEAFSSMGTSPDLFQKYAQTLYGFKPIQLISNINGTIEQTCRLSLYLQELSRGKDISEAVRSVIRTHFDYSDKSLAELYTEIVIPFMSFSFKNLEYWYEELQKNGWLAGALRDVFTPIWSFDELTTPNAEVYRNYDYGCDWEDEFSLNAATPWQYVSAARLYHTLAGNIQINMGKQVEYTKYNSETDAYDGKKEMRDLYAIFKLSPSFLDAVSMLTNPLDAASQRLLPPYEIMKDIALNAMGGETPVDTAVLINNLPFLDSILQRTGYKLSSQDAAYTLTNNPNNNILKRMQELGPLALLTSTITTAKYKDNISWLSGDDKYLTSNPYYRKKFNQYPNRYYPRSGGFKGNYQYNKYNSIYNQVVYKRKVDDLARRTNVRSDLYTQSGYSKLNLSKYNGNAYNSKRSDLIRARMRDKYYYYR